MNMNATDQISTNKLKEIENLLGMKKLLFISLAALLLAACGDKKASMENATTGEIVIGQRDSLYSEILEEKREIWVHVPDGGGIFAQGAYPVLYLLDGPGHFHAVTGLLQNLSANGLMPAMVVVAIPNTDRTRDLTPSHVDALWGDSAFVRTSGGGDRFLGFMEKELIPYVEQNYPVTSYRTFVGHSFGGLASINALLNHPTLFSNYVSIDPSMWWDDRVMEKQALELLDATALEAKSLYLGVANTMPPGMDLEEMKGDTTDDTRHIRSIMSFISVLEQAGSSLEFAWDYYPDDDHGSVPLITEYDAFRFLFSWYRLEGLEAFGNPEAEDAPSEFLEQITAHYDMVSKRFAYTVKPDEQTINQLGYAFMNREKPLTAKALFELNINNYPESANVYDSMADFFLEQADTLQAIANFEKALELGDNPFTREKLEALQ